MRTDGINSFGVNNLPLILSWIVQFLRALASSESNETFLSMIVSILCILTHDEILALHIGHTFFFFFHSSIHFLQNRWPQFKTHGCQQNTSRLASPIPIMVTWLVHTCLGHLGSIRKNERKNVLYFNIYKTIYNAVADCYLERTVCAGGRRVRCGLDRVADQNSMFSVRTPNNSHFSPDKVVNLTRCTLKPDALSHFSIFVC